MQLVLDDVSGGLPVLLERRPLLHRLDELLERLQRLRDGLELLQRL